MTVSNRGRVTWKASKQAENPVHVIVAVKDASGQEVMHHLRIDVLAIPGADKPLPELPEEHFRQWTDASGDFKIEAKFLRAEGARMILIQKDGTTLEIELKDLSLQDQKYVLEKLVELEKAQQ